ncbi:cytochrome aa3 quinol oxidase subunit I [Bacillus sp. FJAT-49736]|uniref:cytochrome aa3 quinol oxidase subunit I n=1 Tax=Bacillus sp. FJAT-49736 TaxID=2833582 RepID=UPI001BC9F2E0|nr:cytochrome aa3 quinol oxidase subunit I [Bacillus sp. FJAT-49736]MBS4174846.1 cytochrome aa3 quinol oxidase subunit I [Bacillus sp. FJAT-49736]
MKLDEFFVTGEPIIYVTEAGIALAMIGILFYLTYFKKWKWLWKNWLTTVDHKKIGVMYILVAVLMLFRGGVDALMMRAQLSAPNLKLLDANHYDGIFTTHGTIMILFMAMPFLMGLINIAVPLQLGARDVAYPMLNAFSFWSFAAGCALFNISFIIGGSPTAGWTSYFPLAGTEFSPGVGNNYYAVALQIAGIGTLITGINFLVTILKMRAKGMTMMKMPMFVWSVLIMCVIIIFAFPVLTVALALMTFDRLAGSHFFTMAAGGMPMLWSNLFWIWGHPEVYIVLLPSLGIYSEIISTFSKKRLFGYKSMVFSMLAIALFSYFTWVHHFFTMGNTAAVNSFFSISTMLIAIPTGVKLFNWIFTMRKGKMQMTSAMLWSLAFIPNFLIGGITGVMLAMAAADYQYHNSYFLIAHFHYTLIPGVAFACFAGLHYWYPKMFGHMLNERLGKITFWLWMVGFNVCFLPQFVLGLKGMVRRMYTYQAGLGWEGLNIVSTVGGVLMGIGFLVLVWNIIYSLRHGERDVTGDPWDGRTLEWATPTPVPHYNFAVAPVVDDVDAYWNMKQKGKPAMKKADIKPIHMPNNTGMPFIAAVGFGLGGFGLVFSWWWLAIIGLIIILGCLAWRSFDPDKGYHVEVKEILETEEAARGEIG